MTDSIGLAPLLVLLASTLFSQALAQESIPISLEERQVLGGTARNEAGCSSQSGKVEIDFNFRFAAAFRIFVSSHAMGFSGRDVDGENPQRRPLKLVARIVPLDQEAVPSFLRRNLSFPRDARRDGKVGLSFRFFLGSGKYRLDWLVETESGKICSGKKEFQPRARNGSGAIRPSLEPGQSYFDGQTPPPPWWYSDRAEGGIKLKILLNIPPFKEGRPLFGADLSRIQAMLTWLTYHPRVSGIELVVFNLKDQRVIYRQELHEGLPDPDDLAAAVRSLSNSQVRLETLREKADSRFLKTLLVDELSSTRAFDAVVLLGPRASLEIDAEATVAEIRDAAPVHYFKYRFFVQGARWTDPLQRVTRQLGGQMHPIQSPQDLWDATRDLVERVKRVKSEGLRNMAIADSTAHLEL